MKKKIRNWTIIDIILALGMAGTLIYLIFEVVKYIKYF